VETDPNTLAICGTVRNARPHGRINRPSALARSYPPLLTKTDPPVMN
jgi:hypothetical protein